MKLKNDGGPASNIARDVARAKQARGEDDLAVLLDTMKLPYVRQYAYAPPRKLRADFALVEQRLLIELQGGIWGRKAHGSITGVLADIDRLNEAVAHGWRLVRVTPDMVMDGRAEAMLVRVFREG